MALELGASEWKLGFGVEAGRKASQRTVVAGDLNGLILEIARAKHRLGVPESARVVSCYEAGRDGFWLHRFLLSEGVENVVMDSSSIEVNRRHRRAKTDGGGRGEVAVIVDPLRARGEEGVRCGVRADTRAGG